MKRIKCTACALAKPHEMKHCHECRGIGYIEISERPADCTGQQPECPVSFDPGVGGWECSRCGESGPL